jgi:hypothetical protein
MSTTSTSPLSAGVQQLYNQGVLPSGVSTTTLSKASTSQLNQLARLTVANQETSILFGSSSYADSSALSTTATNNALLQEINPISSFSSSTSDPLTTAVDNALLSQGNTAASHFLPPPTTTGSKINVLG